MKKVIKGKLYSTESAKKLATYEYGNTRNNNYYIEQLYRKRTGEYFIYGKGKAASKYAQPAYHSSGVLTKGEAIVPVTAEWAKQWSSEHLDKSENSKLWENTNSKDIHVQIQGDVAKRLDGALKNGKLSLKEIVTKALDQFL